MKNKYFKVLCIGLFGVASFYMFKNWQVYNDKSNIDVGKIEFSQIKLNVEEIKSSTKEPIWFIKTENPVVAFKITFKNEGDRSFYETPGLLDLVTSTLLEGAGDRDGVALKRILTDNSISISIESGKDNLVVNVNTVSRNFRLAVDLISEILSKAHLKKEKLEITKQNIIVSLNQSKFSTDTLAEDASKQAIYPKGHPYRITTEDLLKSIPAYTKDQCDNCYESIFSPKNAEITIAGNIDKKDIEESFEKLLKSISHKKNNFKDEVQKTEIPHQDKVVNVELDNPQSTVVFNLPGVQKNSPDIFAARFANTVFGGGLFIARLLKGVRSQNGLVYGIYSTFKEYDMHAHIYGVAKTRPENVEKVVNKIKEECSRFYKDGITKEELETFKTYIFGSNVLDTTGSVVNFADKCRFNGIKIENINNYLNSYYNLSINDVNNAIKKVFDPKELVFVTSGKFLQEKENKNEKTK